MDFGVSGFQGLVNPDAKAQSPSYDFEGNQKEIGSGFVKQGRSGSGEDDWRTSKSAISDTLCMGTPLLRSNSQEHMLSFSSVKSETPFISKNGGLMDIPIYSRNAGYGSLSLNANMHEPFAGVKGVFTPSQWIELEHQALIYKYITANVPVPSNLLLSLKKSINPLGLSSSFAGSYPPTSLRWGSLHFGLSGNSDPEPGRCRRTDGKKWRCSRDAVPDQKYCERHINRGRHRSRKHVEGQTGHASCGAANARAVATSISISTIPPGGAPNSLVIPQNRLKSLKTGVVTPSEEAFVNRGNLCGREEDTQNHRTMPSTMNLKSQESPFTIPKQDIPFGGSSLSDFGIVSSDSLLNPSQKSPYINSKSYGSFLGFTDQETQDQHVLRHFTDNWPNDRSSSSVITWPEELKSDWTQLSMSIPMGSCDFSSSSSSPMQEKLAHSPMSLSHEFDPMQVGLRENSDFSEPIQDGTNWIPISWGASLGGPLGEVLTSTPNTGGTCSISPINPLTEGWDVSQYLESSPTGVLQKATFASLSNSSSGSSPKGDNKNHDTVSFCDNMLGL